MKITKLFFIFLTVESSKSQSWGLRKRARKEQKFLRGEKGDFFIFREILTVIKNRPEPMFYPYFDTKNDYEQKKARRFWGRNPGAFFRRPGKIF